MTVAVRGASPARRSLTYIKLAVHLAAQPRDVRRVVMKVSEIEDLLGAGLPGPARYPSWWRNDPRKMHSRAWLTAGWEVEELVGAATTVVFFRSD